jgi:hypothetical protein
VEEAEFPEKGRERGEDPEEQERLENDAEFFLQRTAPGLARISRRASAASETGMSTALRSVGFLSVVSATSPETSVARLVSAPVSTPS